MRPIPLVSPVHGIGVRSQTWQRALAWRSCILYWASPLLDLHLLTLVTRSPALVLHRITPSQLPPSPCSHRRCECFEDEEATNKQFASLVSDFNQPSNTSKKQGSSGLSSEKFREKEGLLFKVQVSSFVPLVREKSKPGTAAAVGIKRIGRHRMACRGDCEGKRSTYLATLVTRWSATKILSKFTS